MPRQETVLTAFVASPADVEEERAMLEEVIRELNTTWSKDFKLRIELIKWETHSFPAAGGDPQSTINKQIGDDYDIFIGIMWARFGTPTSKKESGTEEEFERAYSRHLNNPNSIRIMFYFKDAPVAPSKVDGAQLSKISAFKKKLGEEGTYYWTFNDQRQFASSLRLHLSRVIQDWQASQSATHKKVVPVVPGEVPAGKVDSFNQSEELGFLDSLGLSIQATELSTNSSIKLATAINELTESLKERTDQMLKATQKKGTFDWQSANRISNLIAQDMEVFVSRTEAELPIFAQSYRTAVDHLSIAVSLGVQDFNTDRTSIEVLRGALFPHSTMLPQMRQKIQGMRDSAAVLPRLTSQFNKARRHTVEVLDKLLAEVDVATQSNTEVLKVLDGILASF
jgi:Domain of unknown function (DUF4062)